MSQLAVLWENPVVTRETRARWRGRAFLVLFGYAFLLGAAMLWVYSTASRPDSSFGNDNFSRMARVGHELFENLNWIQTFSWMLMAPAVTATGIAWEREAGVLESLQMSPLPGWKVAAGKLVSALFFIALLLLAALPVTSICFLMGGVSLEEFQASFGLQTATALTGACIGLCCSALCRRANTALTVTFSIMLIWFFGSLIAYSAASPGVSVYPVLRPFLTVLGNSNPLFAALDLTTPVTRKLPSVSGMEAWQVCLLVQALTWLPLFFFTARATSKPLPEATWVNSPVVRIPRKKRTPTGELQEPLPVTQLAPSQPTSSRWSAPFVSRIRSRNPLFQREARAKFRLRRLPFVIVVPGAFVALFLAYWYVRAVIWTFDDPSSREPLWISIHGIGFCVLVLACAIMGGSGFSREREAGTWEGLGLSLLSEWEILWAKMLAPLLAVLLYSVPLWPLLILCLQPVESTGSWPRSVGLAEAVVTILLEVAGVQFVLALGLYLSWRSKRTATAIGITLGILIVVWAFIPAFVMSGVTWSQQQEWEAFFSLHNPILALINVVDKPANNKSWGLAFCCVALMWVASIALCFMIGVGLRKQRFGRGHR